MSIQKKSLISNRESVKKAVIAKSTLEPQTVSAPSRISTKMSVQNKSRFKSAMANTKTRFASALKTSNKSRFASALKVSNKLRIGG